MNIYEIQKIVEKDGIIFLSYGGYLSQTLIAGMTDALEKESRENSLKMSTSINLFTIFIELLQNIMNHSKSTDIHDENIHSHGLAWVTKDKNHNYCIHSQNIVSK
jgi:glucose-6-phosphate-specific signal transduction histidine kinase